MQKQRIKSEEFRKILAVQTSFQKHLRTYLLHNGFFEFHSPKISSIMSDEPAHIFPVKFYDKTAYLTPGDRIYKQLLVASGFDGVFEIGAAYRGEPRLTNRHLSEFTSIDLEMANVTNIETLMKFEEEMLKYVTSKLKREGFSSCCSLNFKIPLPRITYEEAIQILDKHFKRKIVGEKIEAEDEKLLIDYFSSRYKQTSFFLTHFPTKLRDFYYKRNRKNPLISESFDLVWNLWEVTSGGLRETDYKFLVSKLKEFKINVNLYKLLLDNFKEDARSPGGFAIGLERASGALFLKKDIKEFVLLPRTKNDLIL